MAYDEHLAARIRALLAGEPGLTEKAMFGGLAFLIDRHMAVAALSRGAMMVRVGADEAEAFLADGDGARPMEMRGRVMTGWLEVDPAGVTSDEDLGRWVDAGVAHARTLPPK
ncbi:TfoX/Sxy family protein [Janibacter sp. G56]|uniref:TfoX/Sxy family protein n=1 Tax=Janibacter sp. G56 TaxID=3418717 RepID=UPI003D08FC0B